MLSNGDCIVVWAFVRVVMCDLSRGRQFGNRSEVHFKGNPVRLDWYVCVLFKFGGGMVSVLAQKY